jgi:ketosteroid isomerase-like protein
MSRENVEAWRVLIEDFRARAGESDWEASLPGLVEFLDPEVEWDVTAAPMPGLGEVYRGREGVARFWREWLGAWETLRFDYELIDAGDRVVQLVLDQRMRGRSTGIEVSADNYANVATFRNGLMVHYKLYMSHEEALEAVGLRE